MYQAPDLIRCPVCRRVLGELVADLALVRHRKRDMIALSVACDTPRCPGIWISDRHRALVQRVVGLRRARRSSPDLQELGAL